MVNNEAKWKNKLVSFCFNGANCGLLSILVCIYQKLCFLESSSMIFDYGTERHREKCLVG